MQRVLVMGPPGSGESTLARQLASRHHLPVFHLDQAFWRPGWTQAPAAEFAAEIRRIAALPSWVVDGNYTATLDARLQRADNPTWLSLLRTLHRTATHHGKVRPDAAPGCPERLDWLFLRFTWSWNRTHRAHLLASRPIRHASRQIGNRRQIPAAILGNERLNQDRIVCTTHLNPGTGR